MTDRPTAPPDARPRAHPPETTEGWYAFHQILAVGRAALRALPDDMRARLRSEAESALVALGAPVSEGWSAVVPLVGSRADLMLVHFRATLDAIGEVQQSLTRVELFDYLRPVYTFLSVTEAGLYHASAQLAAEATARGGAVGDAAYREAMDARVAAERASAHVQRRLFPPLPPELPYVCFYPMSKRRVPGQNWYALPLEERSRLMMAHGLTGRGYAGRVMQVITGAIGFEAWEWGVTLFAAEPLTFKKIVTDMRFDEVSAEYAEFGEFFVGKTSAPRDWLDTLT
ncbi:MAG: Chlorite dismutase [Gemmatimonadetes bacterium]|nr:Chlorite dismutase [Gemmatimonadota bacterium]